MSMFNVDVEIKFQLHKRAGSKGIDRSASAAAIEQSDSKAQTGKIDVGMLCVAFGFHSVGSWARPKPVAISRLFYKAQASSAKRGVCIEIEKPETPSSNVEFES
ncbi:hypothetical protein Trco_004197 [Trichoderma cornu-damae]|uniref:Uncharacterized protein n=1 Tax=Trichoderma cornu-damae TaxID=654480 RepID=A0A9P8TY07_9HYPO|nr:hypothetical protein Trco_004197 [Trichoderma cornu-damae]